MGYWGYAAEWGCIFMTGLTIMGWPIQAFSITLKLERVDIFRDIEGKKEINCPKATKIGSITGHEIDQK